MSSISQKTRVRKAVQSFYDAFNTHDFNRIPEFTTEDWTHINPFGGWARRREAVLTASACTSRIPPKINKPHVSTVSAKPVPSMLIRIAARMFARTLGA